jgi:ParB-like chromosome segregation protein Spo0J
MTDMDSAGNPDLPGPTEKSSGSTRGFPHLNTSTKELGPANRDAGSIAHSALASNSTEVAVVKAEILAALDANRDAFFGEPDVRELPLRSIRVALRIRQIDGDAVLQMMESIEQQGILQPPTVRPMGNDGDYELVAGLHRLEAAQRLGWRRIACRVLRLTKAQAELVEIDENLIRSELTEAQWAICLSRRQQIYEELYGPAKAIGAHAANAAMGRRANAKMASAFTADAARLTGKSRRTIQRATQRASKLGPNVMEAIVGTALDRGSELDSLCELPPEERQALVEQAVAGVQVSARRLKKRSDLTLEPRVDGPDPQNKIGSELAALVLAWKNASEPARTAFVNWMATLAT